MGASYPESIKTWPPVEGGVDFIQAQHMNGAYEEIIAIETEIDTTIKPQLENIVNVRLTKDTDMSWYRNSSDLKYGAVVLQYLNSLKSMNQLETRKKLLADTPDSYCHDATLCFDTTAVKGYVISCVNQTGGSGDSPSVADTKTRLDVLNYAAGALSVGNRYIVSEKNQTYNGILMESGTGVPNAVLDSGVIHILFTVRIGGIWSLVSCQFNTTTEVLSDYNICTLTYNSTTFNLNASNFFANVTDETINSSATDKMVSMNATIAKGDDGYFYGCLNFGSQVKNGVIVKTLDFINWQFVCIPRFTHDSNAEYEGACAIKSGYLYLALRQKRETVIGGTTIPAYQRTKMILAKLNMTTWEVVDEVILPDSGSRPCFVWTLTKSKLYLYHTVYERASADVVNVDLNLLRNSKVVQQFGTYMNYPTVQPKDSGSWVIVSTLGSSGLVASYLAVENLTQATLDAAFSTMFSI